MDLIKVVVPPLDANCYIIKADDNNNCIAVDVGGGYEKVKEIIYGRGYNLVAAVFTHGHFDHVLDGAKIKNDGVKIYMTEKDEKLFDGRGDLARYCGVKFTPFKADGYLEEKEYDLGGVKFSVKFTAGHTAGSCCLLFDGFLLSGDTLFKGTFGRYDFPSGSLEELKKSIVEELFVLPDDTVVYSGHGAPTTIGEEKENNEINEC